MGVLCEYFMAASDDLAASAIDWVGGPGRPEEEAVVSEANGFPTLSLTGIDPVVMMGTLEQLLTGRSLDDIFHDPTGHQVAIRNGGKRLIWALTESLQTALVESAETRLTTLAEPWAATEEFFGQGDPVLLGEAIVELAALVRCGREHGEQLYCWLCV
jgi:hypothetical protein